MCRLLLVSSTNLFDPTPHLESFKNLSQNSTEYQGHGWGCAWLDESGQWQVYHRIHPVWEDTHNFPQTTLFLVHARSAFRDQGICVENNMPFFDEKNVFIFNGELQGVRLKVAGRIGAEKIFNVIRKMDKGNLLSAVSRAVTMLNKRTRYIRAMNFFIANKKEILIVSQFSESPEYFQLHMLRDQETDIVCSERYDVLNNNWNKIADKKIIEIKRNKTIPSSC